MKILQENVSKQELKEFLYYGMSYEDKQLFLSIIQNNKDDSNKNEFISLKEIARIITIYKESEDYKNKIKYLHNLHDYVYNVEFSSKNKNKDNEQDNTSCFNENNILILEKNRNNNGQEL